jgi:hypothetical protein
VLKYLSETPLNNQYTLKRNKGQEGKTDLVWERVPVDEGG